MWWRLQISRGVDLGGIVVAANERIEHDAGQPQERQHARGRDHDPRRTRTAHGVGISAGDIDRVARRQQLPRQWIGCTRDVTIARQQDRPLALRVDQCDRATLRLAAEYRMDRDAVIAKLLLGAMAELVISERREEHGLGAPSRELDRRNAPTTSGHGDDGGALQDFTSPGYMVHSQELHPFDVTDNRNAHARQIKNLRAAGNRSPRLTVVGFRTRFLGVLRWGFQAAGAKRTACLA